MSGPVRNKDIIVVYMHLNQTPDIESVYDEDVLR